MKLKACIVLIYFTLSLFIALDIVCVRAQWTGTVYIRANGQVEPVTAPITVVGNKTYIFTGDILGSLIIERSSITVDGNGYVLEGAGTGISLGANNYVEIKNLVIKGFYCGISIIDGDNNLIHNNVVTNCQYSVRISGYAFTNKVFGNKIEANNYGVYISSSGASDNRIYGNIIRNNNYGVRIYGKDTKVFANLIEDNSYGVDLSGENSHVYHNTFLSNNYHVSGSYESAKYDDGYPSGGNFWDNYNGVDNDGDGIGDTPYLIYGNIQDGYPLIAPLHLCYAGTLAGVDYYVEIICDSEISDFQFNPEGAYIKFNVGGTSATGFCRVTIPKSLLWADDGWTVQTDGQNVNYRIIPHATKMFLAFTYSGREVQISGTGAIPEFPSATTLLLLILLCLLLFLHSKRKQRPNFQTHF